MRRRALLGFSILVGATSCSADEDPCASNGVLLTVEDAATEDAICDFAVEIRQDDAVIATLGPAPGSGRCAGRFDPPEVARGTYVFRISATGYKTSDWLVDVEEDLTCGGVLVAPEGDEPSANVEIKFRLPRP